MPSRILLALTLSLLVLPAFAQDDIDQDDIDLVRFWVDQGLAQAQFNLGVMYDTGEGVPQDDEEAVRLYRLAADQGLADAQYNLDSRDYSNTFWFFVILILAGLSLVRWKRRSHHH